MNGEIDVSQLKRKKKKKDKKRKCRGYSDYIRTGKVGGSKHRRPIYSKKRFNEDKGEESKMIMEGENNGKEKV